MMDVFKRTLSFRFHRRKSSFCSMAEEDIDHISEKWLSSEDIVLMSRSDETESRSSLDTPETLSDEEVEEFKIEPVQLYSSSSKPTLRREETIAKEHWMNKKDVKQCLCCDKSISVLQSKHHCRSCGGIFCYYCTRYNRRLSPQNELDPKAKKYKVCKRCDKKFSAESQEGQTRSWTNDFRIFLDVKEVNDMPDSAISDADTIKRLTDETDSRGILQCASVRGRLLDVYQDDIAKPTTDRLFEKGMKAAKGNLFSLFKTASKDAKNSEEPEVCSDCRTNLNIDGYRKICKVCNNTFCIDCCDKDVVLTSRNSQRADKEEPIIILGYKNAAENEKLKKKERYRVCRFCKSQYLNENFLRDVSTMTRQLIKLQNQITVEETDCDDVRDLQMTYLKAYGDLCKIIPHTTTQRRLKQNVVNATREFYFERLRSDSWNKSKHRNESVSSDVSEKVEETENESTETEKSKESHPTESFFDMRAIFRRSKPQVHAKDYVKNMDAEDSPEQNQEKVTTFEQSNDWVNVAVNKKREEEAAENVDH